MCTADWPAAAAVELLDRLAAPLRYHGDLDWRGVEICRWLVARRGLVPWRTTADDYLDAPGGAPLMGREVARPWDEAGLAAAMGKRGLAVYEEQVVQVLLAAWSGA